MQHVFIDPTCLAHSILPSTIEEYHKEVSGYLIAKTGKRVRIVSAYPLLSDIKKRTYVEHGNEAAVKRIDGVMQAIRAPLVGGYHSHPDGPERPSKTDVDFIQDRLKTLDQKKWLELIVSVRRKEYQRPRKTGWSLQHHKGRVGLTITPTPWTVFDVMLSGFWITREGKVKQATVSTRLWS